MQLVVCWRAAASTNWNAPNRVLVTQDSTDRREAKVFRAHAAPQGVCDNLINTLKIVAKRQDDGDSPVKMVVQGFQEKSRLKIWTGSEGSIIGDFAKSMESRKVVNPKFTTDFPEAVVREGADELTLRAEEGLLRTFADTTDVGDSAGRSLCFVVVGQKKERWGRIAIFEKGTPGSN